MNDCVNHPSHYETGKFECKDEQLENYRIAIGILVAVIVCYVALTVAV